MLLLSPSQQYLGTKAKVTHKSDDSDYSKARRSIKLQAYVRLSCMTEPEFKLLLPALRGEAVTLVDFYRLRYLTHFIKLNLLPQLHELGLPLYLIESSL